MDRGIAGVILAGGKSERMGVNKAFLDYKGRPMIDHMKQILSDAGCSSVYISGTLEGYESIPDDQAHVGPACAIAGLLRRFTGRYDALLFVPVDMPLLEASDLQRLTSVGKTSCYAGHPLPAVISTGVEISECRSVRDLLEKSGVMMLDMSPEQEERMLNANTPDEWRRFLS